MANRDEFDEFEEGGASQTNTMEVVMRDYLPYWPVITLAAILGFFAGSMYLKTQVPVYQVDAKILLKDEVSQSTDAMMKQVITGQSQSQVDGELEIIQSYAVMRDAAIRANAQVEFVWDGRIRKQYEDAENMPIEVLVDTFKVSGGSFTVDYKSDAKTLTVGGKDVPWGVWTEVEGNRIYVQRKEGIEEKELQELAASSAHILALNIYTLGDAANRIKGSFVAEPDKKEYLLNLSLTNTNTTTGKRWLTGIIEAYQVQTQAEKRKKNQMMMESSATSLRGGR